MGDALRRVLVVLLLAPGCGEDGSVADGAGGDGGGDAGLGDGSGPRCDYPAADVELGPADDVPAIVEASLEGTVFLLRAGVYRLVEIEPKQGQAFHGERGAGCERLAVLSGAQVLEGFQPAGAGVWRIDGQTAEGQVHGDCEDPDYRCDRPEDLFFDERPLQHVPTVGQVAAGTWHFDYAADSVYLGDDPAGHLVELSVARHAFGPDVGNVTVQGLVVEKYAIPPQMGAIGDQYPGSGWTIEDNEIGRAHV